MFYTQLPQRALLALSGEDSVSFLQGLVTANVARLAPGDMAYAALLSPQGKFLHDFFLLRRPDDILVDVARERLGDLQARLALYKLRAKVLIQAPEADQGVVVAWGGGPVPGMVADPRLEALGYRGIGDVAALMAQCAAQGGRQVDATAYDAYRIALAVPDGAIDLTPDKSLIMEWGFQHLGAIDFSKGCYIGQEVTARMRYRAQIRKSLYRVTAPDAEAPVGTPIMQTGAAVGEWRSHAAGIGIALLRIEAVEAAAGGGAPLTLQGAAVHAARPDWLLPQEGV